MSLSDIMRGVPLIGCVAVIYAVLAMSGADLPAQTLTAITLPSGHLWTFATADLFLLLSVIALYFEVLKATRTSQASVVDHILSLFAFVFCLVGFLLVPSLGTSTFLLISVMAMFDVIAGFTITITSARRDFAYTVDRP
jgi:hypothetical protein